MKREDLYKSRGEVARPTSYRGRSRFHKPSIEKRYPLCSLLQVGIAFVLLLILAGSSFFFSPDRAENLQNVVRNQLETQLELASLQQIESLKDIFEPSKPTVNVPKPAENQPQ